MLQQFIYDEHVFRMRWTIDKIKPTSDIPIASFGGIMGSCEKRFFPAIYATTHLHLEGNNSFPVSSVFTTAVMSMIRVGITLRYQVEQIKDFRDVGIETNYYY